MTKRKMYVNMYQDKAGQLSFGGVWTNPVMARGSFVKTRGEKYLGVHELVKVKKGKK